MQLIKTCSITRPLGQRICAITRRQFRAYGTEPKRRRKFDAHLSLQYFIETSKARSLWRFIVRCTNELPVSQRQELREWARHDFERHAGETSVEKIKYLVSHGTKEVNDMAKYMQLPMQFELRSMDEQEGEK